MGEELCMDRYQCPAAETNKRAHGHFMETAWLVNHIKGVDGQMADCVHHGPAR